MPTLTELLRSRALRIEDVPDTLSDFVDGAQPEILEALIALIAELDVIDGAFALTDANLARVEVIVQKLNTFIFSTEYIDAVTNFAKEFNVQKQINDDIFKAFFSEFENKSLYDATVRRSQKTAIDLLAQSGVDQAFLNPLRESLTDSIVTSQSITGTIKKLRIQVLGDEKREGLLSRHVKQVARDGFSIADRQHSSIVANDLGFEWARYVGGRLRDSRDFCVTDKVGGVLRMGNYFHVKEISEWGNIKQWQGRFPVTDNRNIFNLLGGYNCQHILQYVSISNVPPSVIERNTANGNYKP